MCVASSFSPRVLCGFYFRGQGHHESSICQSKKEPNELFFWFSNLGKSILEQFSWTSRIGRKYISVFCPVGIFFFTVAVLTLPLPEAISKSILSFLAAEYAPSSLLSHGIRWENVKLNVTTFKREHSISQSSTYWSSRPPSASKVKQN